MTESKKWKKDLWDFLLGFSFSFYLALLVFGVSLFWIGLHNFDSGHNLNYVNAATNNEFVDYYTATEYKNPYQMITDGVNQMILGFILSLVAAFEIPLTLWIMSSNDENKKKVKRNG
jgi:hypothetical protein